MPAIIITHDTSFNIADDLPHWFWSGVVEGRWEPRTFRLLKHLLSDEWRFVDIGAWIGPTALFAAKRCRHVDAFECDPVAIAQLRSNIAANPDIVPKIRLFERALGTEDNHLRLFTQELGNSQTSIYTTHERAGAMVECARSLVAQSLDSRNVFLHHGYASDERTFVKIDAEGAEFAILPHLGEIINESRCVWYISFHETNINPVGIPARHARMGIMLRTLSHFGNLRWFGSGLREFKKEDVLNGIVDGTWPYHTSLVFSRFALPPIPRQ